MKTILVVGYNAWDTIIPLPKDPPEDSKLEVERIIACGGGPAANAAGALARWGVSVRLVTVFGDDEAGRQQQRELGDAGVDLSCSIVAQGASTPRSCILVRPDGARRILWSRGNLPAFDPDLASSTWLDGVDLLYCDSHEIPLACRLAGVAAQRGILSVMDAGTCRDGSLELSALCTDVISSTIFAPVATGRVDPDGALRALRTGRARRVAVTFGAAGCMAFDGAEVFHVPAFSVRAVDTTGAGDLFHAGYAFALSEGRGFRDALTLGAAAAALKCRGYGGRASAPSLEQVRDLLSNGETSGLTPNDGIGPATS